MGIESLLQVLKPIIAKAHIQNFTGKTAAVDASAWLYKGLYSCSWELATGLPTYNYLHYPLKMIDMLISKGVKPILVFDGLTLPLKEGAIAKRKADKVKNKELAEKLLAEGKKEQAASMYARCMSVKTTMIHTLMDILNARKIDYIVAPYEADVQIAYLCKEKIADFAISEDSDLLVYGVENIVFKLDQDGGCDNIQIKKTLWNSEFMKGVPEGLVKTMSTLPIERFMELCIISGCDYLSNIPGFAMKSALKMLKDFTLAETLERLQYKKQFIGKIPEKYKENVEKAKLQFFHGKVIDPSTFKMIEYTPIPEKIPAEMRECLGKNFEAEIVEQYAKGLYSVKKNVYRERLCKEEIDLIYKAMNGGIRAKFTENKMSANKVTEKIREEAKSVASEVLQAKKDKNSDVEPIISNENIDINPEPNQEVLKEIDILAKELNDNSEKPIEKPQEKPKSPQKEIAEQQTPNLIKHNPFMKQQNSESPAGTKTSPEESKKKTFYSFFQGDSLTEFFKRDSKRIKEDNEGNNGFQ